MKNNPLKSVAKKGISLIIPVLNEENTLESILERCSKQKIVKQIIVIDDGSKDKTSSILKKKQKNFLILKKPVLTLLTHKTNLGKGAAIRTGLSKAVYKYILIQDADLEYSPEEIIDLYKKAEKVKKGGVVFGTRSHHKKKGYILAQLGNWYLNNLFNTLFDLKLTDSYTCYKLMPVKIWKDLKLKSSGFEIDAEIVCKLGIKDYKISEIPISYNPRKYSEGKKIKWVDVLKATKTAFAIRFSNLNW